MKRISILVLTLSILLCISCKKEYDVQMNQDVKVTVQGYLYDRETAESIANATISWPSGSATSDANGFFRVGNLSPGSLTFTIEADSFAAMFYTLEMGSYNNSSSYTETMMVYMYKQNQTLITRVYENVGSLYKPIGNVPYQIDLGTGFLNRIIRGVTDADGKIELNNLPDAYIQLRVDFEEDGIKYGLNTYNGYITGYPEEFQSAVFVEELLNTGSLLISASNILDEEGMPVYDFIKTNNITMEFTVPVDLEYSYTTIELYKFSGTRVAINVTWSNDNQTLTIDPIGDSLEVEGSYYVYLLLRSEDGSYLNNYSNYQEFDFMVESSSSNTQQIDKVGELVLEYPTAIEDYTSYIRIIFPEVDGAYYYEIYGQYDNGEYLYLTYEYDSPTGDGTVTTSYIYLTDLPGITVPAEGLFANGKTYKIIVRARDSESSYNYGPFSDPLILSAE